MPITLLPPEVAAKIAAGEVVERPASVVKELIENAIDAGARTIRVEIRAGGAQLIRVTDDGGGIAASELPLAVQRHATSKIATVSDLGHIVTLGFRGEALASIAAVAEMTVVSRPADQPSARYVVLRAGTLTEEGWRGAPPGTAVIVRSLFRELPARLKFLRSASTEASQVSHVVCQYALAFPEVRFTLTSDDRVLFQSLGTGSLREVLAALYGVEVAESLRAVDWQSEGAPEVAVSGYVSDPNTHRATRAYLSFFVNRRWVRNRSLGFAVEEAYHGLLPQGRHPIAALHVQLPVEELDVNIHPAKLEIRFLREAAVYGAVQRAVRRTLLQEMSVNTLVAQPVVVADPGEMPPEAPALPWAQSAGSLSHQGMRATPSGRLVAAKRSGLRVLGQLGNTFIVAEGPDGMYLVDQHRAHERVLYEQMRAERASAGVARQALLEPAVVELRPGQLQTLEPLLPMLADMGFVVERFGERSLLAREVPGPLAGGDPSSALRSIFDDLTEEGPSQTDGREDVGERLLVSLACHCAIKSGQVLTHLEMHDLLARLEASAVRSLCPHAEPVMVHLSESAIRKQFGRERGG